MERRALDILGERVLLGEPFRPDDARNRRGPRKPLLIDQKLKRTIAPAAGRHFEHAGLAPVAIKDRPHGETLEERAAHNVLCKLFDRDARLDAADIRLAQHQPIERNITGLTERDLLNRFCR